MGGSTLKDAIVKLATDSKDTLQIIAPILLVIGCLGVGAMYALSPYPVFSDWKQNNPKAFTGLVIGILIMVAAGSVGSLVAFS